MSYIWVPLLACLVLTGIHAYLGIHVLSRGVIFVDLALAQIAAFGAIVALYVGLEPATPGSYLFALAFTMLGAAVFSMTRMKDGSVPQEAIIGIVYAVATAAGIIVMSQTDDVHGVEKIKAILLGRSIVWVSGTTVLNTALIYSVIALVHIRFRRQFLLVSTDPDAARARGLRIGLWDFLFYVTFGFVITSSVQIAGVLLVFSFLIVPAVIGALVSKDIGTRLIVGWTAGSLASVVGLLFPALPSGPMIIVVFGGLLLLTAAARYMVLAERRQPAIVRLGAVGVGAVAVVLAVLLPPWGAIATESDFGPGQRDDASLVLEIQEGLRSRDPLARDKALAAARAHPDPALRQALLEAFLKETEPDLKIHMAEEGLRLHDEQRIPDRRFLEGVVDLVLSPETPFYRREAAHLLKRYTDLELPTEITDAEVERIKSWWKKNAEHLRWDEGRHRFVSGL